MIENFDIQTISLEERLEALLKNLPQELALKQRERFEQADDKEKILEDINEIIKEREEINNAPFLNNEEEKSFNDNLSKEERKKFDEKIKKIINEVLNKEKHLLGEGKTAKVVTSQINSETCLKIITNPEKYKEGNNVKVEAELLETAIKANKTNVIIPKPYYYKMSKKTQMYAMQRLNAVSLKEVMEGEKELPENFEQKKFFGELAEFLKNIHKEGTYHRDFHSGNIMIDLETGNPCVIDFGLSKKTRFEDEKEIYRDDNIILIEDEANLAKNRVNFNNYILKRE